MIKKIKFKNILLCIGGFIFIVSLGFAIALHTINYVNTDPYKTTYSVNKFKLTSDIPFYDMYDAYEYIINDKLILMSEKQIYEIQKYKTFYHIKDTGDTQVNAMYTVEYKKQQLSDVSYDYHKSVYNGNLYIRKSLDYPVGIEFTFVCDNKNLSYTIYLTVLDIENIKLETYINKISDYIVLVQNHNI